MMKRVDIVKTYSQADILGLIVKKTLELEMILNLLHFILASPERKLRTLVMSEFLAGER